MTVTENYRPSLYEATDTPGARPNTIEQLEQFIDKGPITVGRFNGEDLSQDYNPDGVYISPSVEGLHDEDLPQLESLMLLPGAELCAADSHHQVAVADAALTFGGQTVTVRVAVKPFTTESGMAAYEHNASMEGRIRGFDVFKPLALAKDGDTTYLITEWRSEVTSLDNEDWSIKPSDPRYEEEVVPNLTFIAKSLAQTHASGIFPEDGQPKNLPRTDTGSLVLADLEDTVFAYSDNELITMLGGGWDVHDSKALSGVVHCWYAMIHPMTGKKDEIVFLDGETGDVCMSEFEGRILDPYLSELIASCSPEISQRVNFVELKEAILDRVRATT